MVNLKPINYISEFSGVKSYGFSCSPKCLFIQDEEGSPALKHVHLSSFYAFYFKNTHIIILFYYGNVLREKKICKWRISGMGYYDRGCPRLTENGRAGRNDG